MTQPISIRREQTVTAADLRRLASYILSAAHQIQIHTLSDDALGLLSEWHKAAAHLCRLTHEFEGSCADLATKRALGMLMRPQIAKDHAAQECEAVLSGSDALRDQLADARWEEAAEVITREVIATYHAALERGQS